MTGLVAVGLAGVVPWGGATHLAEAQTAVDAQHVQYSSAGTTIEAYVARPQGASKSPGLILVHDSLGLNETFQALTRRFAEAGFVALAPHFPSRSGTPAVEPPATGSPRRPPVSGLNASETVRDLGAAFAFLSQDAGVDAARISVVGVGWGGYRAWKLAEQTPALHRAVIYYGITPSDDDRLRTIDAPVLGHYAEQDYLVTARVLKTKQLLGEKYAYHIYPTVPGFVRGGTGQLLPSPLEGQVSLRGSSPQAVAAAAMQAWTRTLEFLRQ